MQVTSPAPLNLLFHARLAKESSVGRLTIRILLGLDFELCLNANGLYTIGIFWRFDINFYDTEKHVLTC
jgi:hypothetical protein